MRRDRPARSGRHAFVARERRAAAPVVDISLFRRPAFAGANVAALVVFFAFIGAIVFLSAYFQQVRGDTPVAAGLQVAVLGVAFAVTAPLSGRLTGRVGPRGPMVIGLVAAGAAMFGLLRLGPDTGAGATWWDFAMAGAGVGLCLTPMTQVAVSAVPAARAGMASSVHNALRQFGQVLGVAVLGAIVYAHGPQGFVTGLHAAMWVSGTVLFAAAILALALLRPAAATPREPRAERPAVTTIRSAK